MSNEITKTKKITNHQEMLTICITFTLKGYPIEKVEHYVNC